MNDYVDKVASLKYLRNYLNIEKMNTIPVSTPVLHDKSINK